MLMLSEFVTGNTFILNGTINSDACVHVLEHELLPAFEN